MSVEQNATVPFKTLSLALCGTDPFFLRNPVILGYDLFAVLLKLQDN